MIEFVIIIPFLVGIMAAVFFVTWVCRSQQRLRMLERHVPWHVAREGALLDEDDANAQLLLNRAVEVNYGDGTGPGGLSNGLQKVMMDEDSDYSHPTKLDPTDQAMLDLADLSAGTNWGGEIGAFEPATS